MAYNALSEILDICKERNISFYEAVMQDTCRDTELSEEENRKRMSEMWRVMLETSEDYDKNLKSRSGLVGGNGGMMEIYAKSHTGYCGEFLLMVITEALKMGESNACMKRIVAAPTAGSCGVMPAVYVAAKKLHGFSDESIITSMFVAASIGQIIAKRAFIAGATGGCQAEIGTAAAMTAGGMTALKGGTPKQITNAVAMALKSMLGLVCDPVAGLVEVPCVKRNVTGAVNAVACAEMALAGIESAIPVDQVIDAMREVGENMPSMYKETACGGCANTPKGLEVAAMLESGQ
ncbi:MAG: L-serine ammonia-lyase, iron-sulfur-dependent, subunit alpha [Lachnospiraceae bacterium]|nr:L-serine ammonia-lyase, iron-sulfur-dependent, subunit alpha [Lachnospiraceae bacterium]